MQICTERIGENQMNKQTCWQLANLVVGKSNRVLLYGPPGTGKTHVAVKENAPLNINGDPNVFQITMTEESTSADLMGFYQIGENQEFVWHDGIAIQAWRNGGRLVINEIDHASPDAMTFLHAILDDKSIAGITLNNREKETVYPAEGFQVVATSNADPESLPQAVKDRFPVAINIDEINPKALEKFPEEWRQVINDTAVSTDEYERISVRKWEEFFRLTEEQGLDMDVAGYIVFGDRSEELLDAIKLAKVDN